jgi:Terminase large subunit, T4likevirus-type, N-terminal
MLSAFLKEIEQQQARRRTENALAYYRPYAKQREFHAAGARARERLLMAGNQLGKTIAGGFEAAMHATGRYPGWWQGKKMTSLIRHRFLHGVEDKLQVFACVSEFILFLGQQLEYQPTLRFVGGFLEQLPVTLNVQLTEEPFQGKAPRDSDCPRELACAVYIPASV